MAESGTTPLDTTWLRRHPLREHPDGTDKNSRGRVLAVGGSRLVPGGLKLTGEAAFRSGAGKVQFATIEACAIALGMAVPEAGMIGLDEGEDGEIAESAADQLARAVQSCDCLVLGPGMAKTEPARALLRALLADPRDCLSVLLDAAAIGAAAEEAALLRPYAERLVITPHTGEMAALLGVEADAIDADREGHVRDAAERFGAVVLLKGSSTLLATPDGELLEYAGGGVGLATGGSGDVLAGIVAGLLARGHSPLEATAWGVWLHGEAGRRLAERHGPIGFLARELSPLVPGLMRGVL